jgi:hypothetical protein
MRVRRSTGLVTAAAVAASLTVLIPSAARASNPAPDCSQGGATGTRNVYYWNCVYSVPGTWRGAPIVSGQGTGHVVGTCVGGSLPYFITVSWVDGSGTTQTSAPYTLDCAGGKV